MFLAYKLYINKRADTGVYLYSIRSAHKATYKFMKRAMLTCMEC